MTEFSTNEPSAAQHSDKLNITQFGNLVVEAVMGQRLTALANYFCFFSLLRSNHGEPLFSSLFQFSSNCLPTLPCVYNAQLVYLAKFPTGIEGYGSRKKHCGGASANSAPAIPPLLRPRILSVRLPNMVPSPGLHALHTIGETSQLVSLIIEYAYLHYRVQYGRNKKNQWRFQIGSEQAAWVGGNNGVKGPW